MNWPAVTDAFEKARALPRGERMRFLGEYCADDDEVRREAVSLIQSYDDSGDFLESPALEQGGNEVLAAIPDRLIGARLGAYEITRRIGEGGMGAVYEATRADGEFRHRVAIKIVREDWPDRRRHERFRAERQILADLSHPHIARLLDGGATEEHAPYLVMELIEGEPIDRYCESRGVALAGRLALFTKVCEAVEYANRHQVIHCDIKPGNILVTGDGTPKLLDFGISKLLADTPQTTTKVGRAATPEYASPEQITGGSLTAATDVYSLGAVLRKLTAGLPEVPPTLVKVIAKATQAHPNQRYASAAELGEAARTAAGSDPSSATERFRRGLRQTLHSRFTWFTAAALFIGMVLYLGLLRFPERTAIFDPVTFQIFPPEKTTFGRGFALSPDGRQLAFSAVGRDGRSHLWVRSLRQVEPRLLPGTDGAAWPFWSPDGKSVGFWADVKLKRIEISGGTPQVICDAGARGASWGANGVILFATNWIFKVPATGGAPVPVTRLDPARHEIFHGRPFFLPDGRHFLYVRATTNPHNNGIYVGALDAGPGQVDKRLMTGLIGPGYLQSHDSGIDQLFFVRDHQLMVQAFDPRRLELSGDPLVVVEQVGDNGNAIGYFSVSAGGALAYSTGNWTSQLTWFDRAGSIVGRAGDPAYYDELELSPDGTRAAAPRYGANHDIWLIDLIRGTSIRFTFDPGWDASPVWSPDASQIVFNSNRGTRTFLKDLYRRPSNGARDEEALLESGKSLHPLDWSSDGRFLLYAERNGENLEDLWVLENPADPPSDRKSTPFLATPFRETQGKFSPDGHWVAYVSDESGRAEVFVRPFPLSTSGSAKWLISNAGGAQPRWRRDGKELFYLAPDSTLMAVEVVAGKSFEAGAPKPLFVTHLAGSVDAASNRMWDVSRDGQRFLIAARLENIGPPISVLLNWQAALKKKE